MIAKAFNSQNYRYSYQGQEKDDEFNGNYAFDYRIYDPRIARFLSIDPLIKEYPHYTPYSFSGNKPTGYKEREGLEEEGIAILTGPPGWVYIAGKWIIIGGVVVYTTYIVVEHSDDIIAPFKGTPSLVDAPSKPIPITTTTPEKSPESEPNKKPDSDPKPVVPPTDGKTPRMKPFWVTYTRVKIDEDGNETYYVGRTKGYYNSAQGTPTYLDAQKAVNKRLLKPDHVERTKEGYGGGEVDKFSRSYNPIRGREQQLIDYHGGSQSDGGTTGNKYRGVAKDNENGLIYHNAASQRFGELHPYTGNLPNNNTNSSNGKPNL